jgi:hypothetical protein
VNFGPRRSRACACAKLAHSPADFGKLIVADTEKWAKVIRAAHIKAD